MSEFIIKENGKLLSFENFEDVPAEFDYLIKCSFDYPDPPHSEEQHAEIETYNGKLQELMRRQR